jgi:IBR domain, a half RING-finger domain
MQTSENDHDERLQATTSCDEMVALRLSQYRPKAREIQLTCSVCMESLPLHDFPAAPIASTCLLEFHRAADKSFTCKSCINDSIQAQLNISRPDTVHCPLCNELMSYPDVMKWAAPDVFERYDQMVTLEAIQQDGSFIRCCRADCDGGQFHDGGADFPVAVCQACGTMTCYRHTGLPWREGLTCDEFEDPHTAIRLLKEHIELELASNIHDNTLSKRQSPIASEDTGLQSKLSIARQLISERMAFLASESDEKGARAVAKMSKPCPHCHSPVEKRGGCKHITCRCGYQFCYGCLARWDLGHLTTPCSAEHDHADILRFGKRNDVPYHGPGVNFPNLAAQRNLSEARGLPVVANDIGEGRQPRPQAAELENRFDWLVRAAAGRAGMIAPLRAARPLAIRGTVLLTSPQRPGPPRLGRLTRPQDLQVTQADHVLHRLQIRQRRINKASVVAHILNLGVEVDPHELLRMHFSILACSAATLPFNKNHIRIEVCRKYPSTT